MKMSNKLKYMIPRYGMWLITLIVAMIVSLTSKAQTLEPGYYHIYVTRTFSYVYAESGTLKQDVYYSIPSKYALDDLSYVFKFEENADGSFKIKNCRSNEYIVVPPVENPVSQIVGTGNNSSAFFRAIRTYDDKCWGFETTVKLEYGGGTYEIPLYLNDLQATYLCLWTASPNSDTGSQFLVDAVDEASIKSLLEQVDNGDDSNDVDDKDDDNNAVAGSDVDQSVELWGEATDTLALQMDDYCLLIPDNMIKETDVALDNSGTMKVTLKGTDRSYVGKPVIAPHIDDNYPKFRTFKFNNKYNDILVADIDAQVNDNEVYAYVTGCIGKTLSPSFSLTNEDCVVYHEGERQLSHGNRVRFDTPQTYTLARSGYRILQVIKTKDEVWSNPGGDTRDVKVQLTADQLSTNAPSGRGEGIENLVDDDLNTYYHSTWTNDPVYTPLTWNKNNPDKTEWPYVDIKLEQNLQVIKWGYVTTASNRVPTALSLQASIDGQTWVEVAELKDELPQGDSETFLSDVIDMGRPYSYIRVKLVSAAYKNYLCMREMYLYNVESVTGDNEPELLQEAEYEYNEYPWGRKVKVNVEFATDKATNVPRIDINLSDGYTLNDIHRNKTVYYPGKLSIDGADVFPDMEEVDVNMRGRGNSSWSASKKPYRLKFNSKQKPFGLKKGKSWVLIAQAQTGSMLTNPIAQRVATMTGTPGANHCIPVELYVNGDYLGSYMFTENPGLGSNSVDIDETNAYALELDTYYDEPYRFQDDYYYLPVNIKDPDLTEETDGEKVNDILYTIKDQFNAFAEAVYNRDNEAYETMMDIDSWSRFMLVNDVVRNTELMWPKSVKLFRVDMTNDDDKLVWGPCWDFDWAFGYENGHNYYIAQAENDLYAAINYTASNPYYPNNERHGVFFGDLLYNSELLQADRYRVWTEFMNDYRDELLQYIDDYLKYAQPSFANNSTRWGDGRDYTQNAANAKSWLMKRTDWVYGRMKAYDLPVTEYAMGDVNEDGRISVGDAICIANRMLGLPNDFFNSGNADMNGDDRIDITDLQLVIRAILEAEAEAASARSRMPQCAATITMMPFTTNAFAEAQVAVNLTTEETAAGMQMDVVLPAGALLTNVHTSDAMTRFTTRISDMGNSRYRVLVMPRDGQRIEVSDANNIMLSVTMGEIPADKAQRVVRIDNVIMSSLEGTDMAVSNAHAMFAEANAIEDINADEVTVRGGDDLCIESVKDGTVEVYNLAGVLVARVKVARGTTNVNLPMGVYIVNGYKVTID